MSQLPEWGFTHLCMHIAGGGELASEGAAEGVRGVDDGAAPAGSWQVCAHESLRCIQVIASAESLSHPWQGSHLSWVRCSPV